MTKKIFAMFLAVLMVVSMLPTSVFAAEACPGTGVAHSLKNCADYTAVYVKPANCGEQGYTTYKCNKCSVTFVDSWTAPYGEHTMVPAEAKDNVPAYCGVEGKEGGMICSVCKNHREGHKVIPAIGEKGKTQCEMPAWEVVVKDCKEEFTLTRTCLNCTKTEEYKYKPAQGHDHEWSAWEVKTPATATAPGVAVRKCTHKVEGKWSCGATQEEEIFFAHEHDDKTLRSVSIVPATCETAGKKAHDECRICGKLFVDDEEVTAADLVIPSVHDQIKEGLDCTSTTKECDACHKIIKGSADDHTWSAWKVQPKATCLTDGFKTRECQKCAAVDTEIIPALGHATVTKTVEATCVQYAYTYTYCVRSDCPLALTNEWFDEENDDLKFDTVATFAPLQEVLTDMPLYLGAYNAKEQAMEYLDGTFWKNTNGEENTVRLNVTKDPSKAAQYYIEAVEGGYHIYMLDENDAKIYVWIKADTYGGIFQMTTTEPKTVWTWSETHKTLVTTIGTDDFGFTSRNGKDNADYVYGLGFDYFEVTNPNAADDAKQKCYIFQFSASVTTESGKVHLLSCTPNYEAGKNADNHDLETLSEVPATCLAAGTKIERCTLCNKVMPTETLAKVDHKWVDSADTTGNVAMNCITDGKTNQVCEYGCGAKQVKVTPAEGHKLDKDSNGNVIVEKHLGNHLDLLTYSYNICENANCPLTGKRVIIEGTYGAWAGAGTIYESLDKAVKDHPNCDKTGCTHGLGAKIDAKSTKGDCTTPGYDAYECACCGNTVRVKAFDSATHTVYAPSAPTCTTDGGFYTYTCKCGKVVGEACTDACTHAAGQHWNKTADKLGHDWEMNEDYDPAEVDCDAPEYNTLVKSCKRTDCNEKVFAHKAIPSNQTSSAKMCENGYYEHYFCYECNENHMRSFVSGMAHEWVNVGTPTAPTCTKPGHQDKVCKWCGKAAEEVNPSLEVIPVVPHENAAGEKFVASCLDTTADRHCVKCCAHKNADGSLQHNCADPDNKAETPSDCACYFPAQNHVFGEWTYVEDTCEELPYKYHVCSVCYYTPSAEFVSEIQKVENGTPVVDKNGKPVMEAVVIGHRPVAVDVVSGAKVYYGQYTYEDYPEYAVYEWVDAVDAENKPIKVIEKDMMEGYEAKYLAYTAPTFTAEGYAKYVCAVCGETHEEILPATAGLGFELEVKNANGQEGITNGSLVNVTLYANGADVEVNFFSLTADFADMVFVGSQAATTDFNITVTNTLKANVGSEVTIIAKAANTADKKQQNITIGEKTPIVVMQFIVMDDGELEVTMEGTAASLNGAAVACEPDTCKFEVKELLNFNEDDSFSIVDLIQAEAILTGESEKAYDVSVDIDKDGEVTLYDLTLIYEFYVNGGLSSEEAFLELKLIGLSEEHVAVVCEYLEAMTGNTKCNSSDCDAEIAPGQKYCPECGNRQ